MNGPMTYDFDNLARQGLFCWQPDMAFKKRGNRHLSLSHYITCHCDGSIGKRSRGDAVARTSSGNVGHGSEGDELLGQVLKYEDDDYASVQDKGYATFRGVPGRLPKEGDSVCCDGHGAVIPRAVPIRSNRVDLVDATGEIPMVTVLLK